ncbi:phosphoadenylyl-sulfate reductase [Sphingomonas koreensis]|jgi:phosphoadenosine phosphosulfate reductase|uniref:Adenosine 5'-phosphosulfate reductase n=1 Tax=Sphingomonas koreensis TaxID=93064 RepID=A0A1L6J8P7_9SPHN|nr:phosphoadenylyl-sulfate reductase [Sphingomonas koreensis]APR52312.1 phosphoadenosine phosphosulfate reductase [Sphingomonas koreensis]MDC7811455.1 phosphoadenylyl-sulfate reductase [Sphingomonas koreensis]RSU19795.1 phosphoadenylyl-sulfate reductase [Sphingomonas koreensis]RSU26583.1 phosphoadenylyl-sulfate reductase [Sphingomonas koreensis]RSU27364.1 phosphoadenylyl-sulfate reductase [Sphingomonas koreensis]
MASVARQIDRIDTAPAFTERDALRLNNLFRGVPTVEMLRTVLAEQMAGDIAIVSSFGAESAVLLHLVASIDPSVPVIFLDTGKHFPETLAYRDQLATRLGLTNLRIVTPDAEVIAKKDETGLRWSYDPDGCCEIRKVIPLEKAMAGFDASITGRKAFQASTRNALPRFEVDAAGKLKVNPLADWTKADLDAYFVEHDLPAHPLVAEGYLSIGCAPCTSKVKPGEDARSGRWAGWDKTECGIHTPVVDGDPDQPMF